MVRVPQRAARVTRANSVLEQGESALTAMRDMHCHILPGVDDGARSMDESLAMVQAARAVGITEIVCTPHCRDPYFDYQAMWDAYNALADKVHDMPLRMGFEVNHAKLMQLGSQWIDYLAFADTDEFLLELDTRCRAHDFDQYKRTIFEIQGHGFQVIIAHPERYRAIQQDIQLALDLVDMGCLLQASTDFVDGGRFGAELKPAKKLLKEGAYTYFASDAHYVGHYDSFARAWHKFGDLLA